MKLRNKSVLIFLLTAIIPIVVVSLIALEVSHRLLRDSIGRNFMNIAREQSLSISMILKDRLTAAKIIAESEQIKEVVTKSNLKYTGKSRDEVLKMLNEVDRQWLEAKGQTAIAEELLNNDLSRHLRDLVQKSEGQFGEIFLTDIHGATVAMSSTLTDYYQGDEQWWQHSFNQGKGADFIDDRGFDESIRALAVGMVVPIKHEDKTIGILKVNNKIQEVIEVIERFKEHEEDHTFLMRSQGDLIAVSTGKQHRDISYLEKEIVAGREDAGWVEDTHQGKSKLMSYSPVPAEIFRRVPQPDEIRGVSGEKWVPTTWYLFIEIDHSKAFAPLNTLINSIVICAIAAVICSVVLAVILARPVLSAIKKLQSGAIKVGQGDLEYKVAIDTNDEIGILAGSFNRMTQSLSDANAERNRIEADLTEKNRLTQVLLDSMPCVAMLLCPQSREIVASNKAAAQVNAVPGAQCFRTFGQSDKPCPWCLAPELWANGKPKHLEVEGLDIIWDAHWLPISEDLYMHYAFDITERKQVEDSLKDKTREMETLLHAVSHDLRSPLVNIKGFSGELAGSCEHLIEMLKNVTADKETKKQIETLAREDIPESIGFIRKGTKIMDGLLKSLSYLAKIGAVKLDIQPLDINDLVGQVVDTMKFSAGKANAAIELETLPGCCGDEVQINQLFSNLIGNAIKYLDPQRPGQIRIWGKVEGNMSMYCVEDNGVGIRDSHKAKVFEIFYRVDPKSPASGDGLGLTTTRRIVERHNGRIWLESEPGKGSRFFVSLPVLEA